MGQRRQGHGIARERVGLLKDLPVSVIDHVIATRIKLMPGGRALLATMKANGAYCALVSGGFTAFTARVADTLGFDENRANTALNLCKDLALTQKFGTKKINKPKTTTAPTTARKIG